MTLKIICAAVIISGCGFAGMSAASALDARIRQTRGFSDALGLLEIEMTVNNSVLCEALYAASKPQNGVVKDIFADAARGVEALGGGDMSEVWRVAIENNKKRLCVSADALDIISAFASGLGRGDREREKDNIRAAREKLRIEEEKARLKKAESGRLYRGLGFACGILITVLLL